MITGECTDFNFSQNHYITCVNLNHFLNNLQLIIKIHIQLLKNYHAHKIKDKNV